jgi:hypothetical protein
MKTSEQVDRTSILYECLNEPGSEPARCECLIQELHNGLDVT